MKVNNNTSFNDTMSFESNRNDEISLLERHDLLTGEPRYIEDEIRNSKFAMIFGGLAGVTALVSFILTWILWFRDRKSITVIHFIATGLATLIGFAVAGWGAQAGSQIAKGQPPSNGLTFLAFAGSLIFAVYFAGAALWLTLYRQTHLCRITSWTSSTELWNKYMPTSWDLAKGWFRDNRLISWLVVLAIICAFCFAFCAYATWTVAYNRFKFASYGLYLSCIGLVLFGWIMIYWAEEAFEWHKYANNAVFSTFTTSFLKVLAIIGIVVGALAIIVRFLRNRTGFFILGMIALVLFILTLTSTGLLFRNVYQTRSTGDANTGCGATLAHLHKDVIAPKWCPSKYLPAGQSCRKSDVALIWEDNNGQTGSLNPACCRCVKEYYVWPFYILGIYSLLFALCAAIAAAALFYLSDNSDHYGGNKVNDGLDFAFLAIALLIILAFGLYFIFRKPNVAGSSSAGYNSFSDSNVNDPNFDRVKGSVLEKATSAAPANNGLFNFDLSKNTAPKFDTAHPTCADANTCVLRQPLLAKNAKFIVGDLAGATQAGENTRLNFFPGCTNKNNDYLTLIGTEKQIADALVNLKFDVKDFSKNGGNPEILAANTSQVKKTDLNGNGLLNTENASSTLNEADDASCAGNSYDFTAINTTTLKGQLFYKDAENKEKNDIAGTVSVAAFRNGSLLGSGNLYENGIYTIPGLPVNPNSNYPVTVKISDSSNIFLEDSFDTVISSNAASEVSTGKTQLVTKDGKVCAAADTACISAQTFKQGEIKVALFNSETGAPVSGVSVDLKDGSSVNGKTVKSASTDGEGIATFAGVNYGKYTAFVNNNDFQTAFKDVTLQAEKANTQFSLNPKVSEYAAVLNYTPSDPNTDFDFKLYAQNPAGYECEVSPLHKYCAYARHSRDAAPGADNSESIQIKDFAVAKYKTTLEPSPAYSGSCAESTRTAVHAQALNSWNWNSFKTNNPLTKLVVKFAKQFDESKWTPKDKQNNSNAVFANIKSEVAVETPAQAAVPKKVMNKGGKVPAEPTVEPTATKLRESEVKAKANAPKDTYDSSKEVPKPSSSASSAEPSSSASSAEPSSSASSAEPSSSASPAEPSSSASPAEPSSSASPAEPAKPANSTSPTEPAKPANSTSPTEPAKPANSTSPAEPAKPANSTSPAEPAKPANSTSPTEPAQPANSTSPTEPAKPAETKTAKTNADETDETANEPIERLLQGEAAANEGPNYLIVDCFTGFGKASFVGINEYVASTSALKSWGWCDNAIASQYTLANLVTANKNAN
jgi:hypothetical protein